MYNQHFLVDKNIISHFSYMRPTKNVYLIFNQRNRNKEHAIQQQWKREKAALLRQVNHKYTSVTETVSENKIIMKVF